jgi:hypothetical protein
MDKGILSFSLAGNNFGPAYQSDKLKTGPIYPAVAILNQGGFHIRSLPIPASFIEK